MTAKNAAPMTAEQFAALVARIAKTGAKLSSDIGSALLSVLYFANVERKALPANELVKALRKSTKQQAIIDLLETHGNLAWMSAKREFAFFDAKIKAEDWAGNVKALREVCAAWEDFKKESAPVEVDLLASVLKLVEKAEKAKAAGKPAKNVDGLAEAIRAAVAKFSADEALKAANATKEAATA